MAILRSNDGRFYDVADDQLADKLIPSDQIKEKLASVGVGSSEGPVGSGPIVIPGTGGQVVIQIYTSSGGGSVAPQGDEDVEAHQHGWGGGHFHNCWNHNCFRNCFNKNRSEG